MWLFSLWLFRYRDWCTRVATNERWRCRGSLHPKCHCFLNIQGLTEVKRLKIGSIGHSQKLAPLVTNLVVCFVSSSLLSTSRFSPSHCPNKRYSHPVFPIMHSAEYFLCYLVLEYGGESTLAGPDISPLLARSSCSLLSVLVLRDRMIWAPLVLSTHWWIWIYSTTLWICWLPIFWKSIFVENYLADSRRKRVRGRRVTLPFPSNLDLWASLSEMSAWYNILVIVHFRI